MSLYITKELLEQYKACEQGIKFMDRFYPDGADCITLLNDKHVPIDFLHWGYKVLPVETEDMERYRERMELVDCRNCFESRRCTNSRQIIHSEDCADSLFVFSSQKVNKSTNVINSTQVDDSEDIYNSTGIEHSAALYGCTNLTDCSGAYRSRYSKKSQGLFTSTFCFNCRNIINSTQVEDSQFCAGCNNIKNCLFCFGVKDSENLVFNAPASPAVIEMAKKEFERLGATALNISDNWHPDYLAVVPSINIDPREWFSRFPNMFWEFVTNLPNYDPKILYSLTFLDRFLLN